MKTQQPKPVRWTDLNRHPVMWLGFGFGSGLAPKGPGTAGTLLGLLLFLPILLWSEAAAWGVLALALVFGSYICGESARQIGVHDHGGIVWDEFVGIWLVLLTLPEQSWLYWTMAFIFFRIFDIVKPWPIRWADQKVSGGFGIMLDDIMAACYAIIIIWALQTGFL
jgi:phosphatidylglycerophosphatase (EC 3.1.3.27)